MSGYFLSIEEVTETIELQELDNKANLPSMLQRLKEIRFKYNENFDEHGCLISTKLEEQLYFEESNIIKYVDVVRAILENPDEYKFF